MSWISFAVFGYFLQAVSVLGDKIILKKILPSPSSYAFWQGILSLGAVILIPFGFSLIPTDKIFISFLAGAFWLYGLFFFFTALRKADASNVLPVVLSITAILLFIMEGFFMGHQFSPTDLLPGVFMVSGTGSLSLARQAPFSFFLLCPADRPRLLTRFRVCNMRFYLSLGHFCLYGFQHCTRSL